MIIIYMHRYIYINIHIQYLHVTNRSYYEKIQDKKNLAAKLQLSSLMKIQIMNIA